MSWLQEVGQWIELFEQSTLTDMEIGGREYVVKMAKPVNAGAPGLCAKPMPFQECRSPAPAGLVCASQVAKILGWVQEGAPLEKGDLVLITENLGVISSILSEESGRLCYAPELKIRLKGGKVIEHGLPLFWVEKTA